VNSWKRIWISYHLTAKTRKLIVDTFRHSSVFDKVYLTITFLLMICSGVLHSYDNYFSLPLLAASEIAFLIRLNKLKENLILNEYGGSDNSQAPPDSEDNKATRYLMFKKALKDNHINKSHVNECHELIDLQIDMSSSSGLQIKRLTTFVVGIFLGLFAAVWKSLDVTILIYIALSTLLISLMLVPTLTFFPSKIEKLKELKYFMLLYCKEIP
jgi:hypothetical protein